MTGQEGLIPGWGTGSVLRILPHYQVILDTDCLKSIVLINGLSVLDAGETKV